MAVAGGIGRAYGSFDTRAPGQDIAGELPELKAASNAPAALGLSLVRVEELKGDTNVGRIRKSALDAGHKFAIVASYPGGTNAAAADHLADIFNAAYSSPLFQYGEDFKGGIAYVDDDTGRLMLHD